MKVKITDEYLFDYFLVDAESKPKEERQRLQAQFSYAITPYESLQEIEKNRALLRDFVTPHGPNHNALLIHAAKMERTDLEGIGA